MGGEPLATPPGYHLFATIIVLFTGMPILLAQMLIAAFFSSFTVFPMYLLSKKMWRDSGAGFLSAFLVTVSSLSMEMLGWGGYPNIISLAFIVLIVYLFLKELGRPHRLHLVAAALVTSVLLLTHLFSLFVLYSILAMYIFLLLLGKFLKRMETNGVNVIRFFLVSVALGTLFASPWLLSVANFYVDMASEGAFLGGMEETRNLILVDIKKCRAHDTLDRKLLEIGQDHRQIIGNLCLTSQSKSFCYELAREGCRRVCLKSSFCDLYDTVPASAFSPARKWERKIGFFNRVHQFCTIRNFDRNTKGQKSNSEYHD